MKKKILEKYVLRAIILVLALAFVAKFGGPAILKLYVETGIGNCQKIPLLCLEPEKEIINPPKDEGYLTQLIPYKFPGISVYLPKGFTVIKGRINRLYYKKRQDKFNGLVIYLFFEKPDFFLALFPRVKKEGITDNYGFLNRMMHARLKDINNLNAAFFAIMKTVLSPDLGDQKQIEIIKFTSADKKGFIAYNSTPSENYFDCDITDAPGNFFKIYIKDKGQTLDLDKVFTIISTLNTR